MSEPWIRVHANLHAKPVIARAVSALGIGENEAVGLMVRFWGSVSQHVINGDLTDVTDRQMELWAGWTKRKGRFAAFVRASHLDADGRVNEWDEYAGKLEARRALDRARKEAERLRKSRGSHAEVPQDVTHDSIPTRANETIRDGTTTTQSPPEKPVPVWQPAIEQRIAGRLTSDAGRTALAAILAIPGCSKSGVCSLIAFMLDGERGEPRATPEQMDRAICDYVTNGMSSGRFNAQHFRACVRRATRPEADVVPIRRGGTGQRSYDNAIEALKDLPEGA